MHGFHHLINSVCYHIQDYVYIFPKYAKIGVRHMDTKELNRKKWSLNGQDDQGSGGVGCRP